MSSHSFEYRCDRFFHVRVSLRSKPLMKATLRFQQQSYEQCQSPGQPRRSLFRDYLRLLTSQSLDFVPKLLQLLGSIP